MAKNALKRKKQHEHSLEQTNGQISMLEQQIYSIESANINQETLVAMKNAGAAMKQIHGKMTMEDVDVTMSVPPFPCSTLPPLSLFTLSISIHSPPLLYLAPGPFPSIASLTAHAGNREQLREQHELTQEIGNAITSMPITEPIDEDELEADLAALEQENLDEKMLKTGTVPQDQLQRTLPVGVNGECEFSIFFVSLRTWSWMDERVRIVGTRKEGEGGTAE